MFDGQYDVLLLNNNHLKRWLLLFVLCLHAQGSSLSKNLGPLILQMINLGNIYINHM